MFVVCLHYVHVIAAHRNYNTLKEGFNMKKIIAILALLICVNAQAGIISLDISDTNISSGNTTQVSLVATSFDAFDAFSFDVEFDTNLFTLNNSSIGGSLFDFAALDPLGTTIFSVAQESFGVSIAFSALFSQFTESNFTAVSFNLTAIENGVTNFSLTKVLAGAVDIFNPFGASVPISAEGNNVDIAVSVSESVSVPAPASIGLFVIALIALMRIRNKA